MEYDESLPHRTCHTIMVWPREKIGPFKKELKLCVLKVIIHFSYGMKLLAQQFT
jgi:hypothetical protein